jgi:hypothetical protein
MLGRQKPLREKHFTQKARGTLKTKKGGGKWSSGINTLNIFSPQNVLTRENPNYQINILCNKSMTFDLIFNILFTIANVAFFIFLHAKSFLMYAWMFFVCHFATLFKFQEGYQ